MNSYRNSVVLVFLFSISMLCGFTACDDDGSEPANSGGDSDSLHGSDDADTDTDTNPPTPYDSIDCDGAGADPTTCESEICFHRIYYLEKRIACDAAQTAACEAELDCYENEFACLINACPLGTALPETHDEKSEAGIYDCDNDYNNCMADLP